ncbi:PQQ-binding-like beta-propeller repeat protein, partial [PVC group bacterium]|nr:PQQ-binding-like beta-propeller repeat protein [PVC group bacterium]
MNIQNTFWIMLCTVVLLHPYGSKALAGDWPTYAKDAQRSGVTTEELSFPLTRIWTYEPARKPQPAWPEPGKELHRLDFDYAPQTVIAEDLVYFSSTSDDTLRAVWLEDGKTKWRFTTGGPLRFAPTIDDGTAYLASDDGWIYALSSRTGKLKWKFRGAPDDDLMLGNARMISRWPIRSGVLIESNVVYFAAGMWPSEGIHVYALNSKTGEQIWCNDSSGSMYRRQPHRSSSAFSGVSPQGYMMLSGDRLLIPSGRTTPAAFNKKTGNLIYYQPYLYEYPYNSEGAINRGSGGWWGIIGEGFFLNPMHRGGGPNIDIRIGESDPRKGDGLLGYSLETGLREWRLDNKSRAVIDNKVLYAVGNGELEAIDMNRLIKDGYPDEAGKWSSPQPRTYALVKAGKHLLAGGRDSLTAFDARNGRNIWKTSISGQVRGIAVASGHVVISTSEGTIACFEHKKRNSQNNPLIVHERLTWKDPLDTSPANLANTVIKQSGISEGYALVAGEDTSCLAKAIASQTDLHVINLLHDEEMLNINRKRLLTTDMYGSRVTVMSIDNSVQLPFPSFFADLVVVSDGLKGSMMPELYRILRPCGGVMCFPGMGNKKAKSLIKRSGAPHAEIITGVDDNNIIIRNKLPEAGEWRYPQADSGNTGVGEDGLAKPPFDLLWFGGPGPDRMMNRHWNGSPPLSVNGRVFVAGQHHVIAFDAYNGREIWSLRLEGAARKDTIARSSNFVADDDSVFVAIGPVCHRLDQATGKRVGVYSIPQNTTQNDDADSSLKNDETLWGYLSVTDSKVLGTTLNGTSIKRAYRGKKAFALMKNGGSAKWIYTCPKNLLSYPVAHGNGRMFIVETSSTNDLSLLIRRG